MQRSEEMQTHPLGIQTLLLVMSLWAVPSWKHPSVSAFLSSPRGFGGAPLLHFPPAHAGFHDGPF